MKEKIRSVAERVDQLKKVQMVGREHIYQEFIVQPETRVSHGVYRPDRLTFEIKKWVDAIYTSNLPDALGILTFVPEGLPTAYDLGMMWSLGRKHKKEYTGMELIDEVADRAKNDATWQKWNEFQNSAYLTIPSPDQLTHQDILEIRKLPSWEKMMCQLENFLDPKPQSENQNKSRFDHNQSVNEMREALEQFNLDVSNWYNRKIGATHQASAEKFAVGIGRIYQWGEWKAGLLYGERGAVVPILPARNVVAPNLNQEELRFGIEAGLFYVNKKGIDWQRSQIVQKKQNQLVVNTDEVRKMVKEIIGIFPEAAPYLEPSIFARMEG